MGSLNVRGCSSIESKRCEIGCMFGRRGMDVLALCETKMKGKEVAFGEVTGRVFGVERGRAREGVALLLSEWMGNKVVEWKEVSCRLMWVRVRMGRECWAFVSAYGPGCERSEEERDEFWDDLTRCVDGLSTRNYVVVLGDLNARVGDGEVEGVVGKYGVPGENESGERLLDMCVEQELVIGNSYPLVPYPHTYIALYFSYAKVTCNTHTKKQEIVSIPLTLTPKLVIPVFGATEETSLCVAFLTFVRRRIIYGVKVTGVYYDSFT